MDGASQREPPLDEHLAYVRERNQRPRSVRERHRTVLKAASWLGHPVAAVAAGPASGSTSVAPHVEAGGVGRWHDTDEPTPASS